VITRSVLNKQHVMLSELALWLPVLVRVTLLRSCFGLIIVCCLRQPVDSQELPRCVHDPVLELPSRSVRRGGSLGRRLSDCIVLRAQLCTLLKNIKKKEVDG
jgi:hypothetical protein